MTRMFLVVLSCCWGLAGGVAPADGSHDKAPRVIFVSVNGNDSWSGNLRVADAAGRDGPLASLDRARDMIRQIKSEGALPAGGVVVELQAGTYYLERPFLLDARDSGAESAPIVYRGREGAAVSLIGGQLIGGWQPVLDPEVLAILDARAVGNVLQATISRHRSELGELRPGAGWGDSDPGLELFFDNSPMTLARWPNQGFTRIGKVLGPTPVTGNEREACREGVFTCQSDRLRRWGGARDMMLHGYWAHDWADQRLKVASLDPVGGIITLDAEPVHAFGFRSGQWFYAYNLLCELDEPGEWYLDRESATLYFWPPSAIDRGRPTVSMLESLIVMQDVDNVTLRGLTLEVCRGTAAVALNTAEVHFVGCTIRNAGGWAIKMQGRRSGARGCDISHCGSGGVAIAGGDRQMLTAGEMYVENCHIFKFGRWNPINKPGVAVDGVGGRVAHNLFHDSPHAAVKWSGNDHVFEFNEFHSVVQGANDAGVMYAGYSPTMRGNVIRYNYFHDVYGFESRGCNGIYLDDMYCSAVIYGNIFVRVPRAILIGGGHDNVVENNVFVDCSPAVQVDARMLTWAANSKPLMKQRLEEVPYREEPWRSRYPELLSYLEGDYAQPKNNVVVRNVSWRGTWENIDPRARGGVKSAGNLIGIDPRFTDEAGRTFSLKPDSPAWGIGFEEIPVAAIGLYESEDRASWPVHHEVQERPQFRLDLSFATLKFVCQRLSARKYLLSWVGSLAVIGAVLLHVFPLPRRVGARVVLICGFRAGLAVVGCLSLAEVAAAYVLLPTRASLVAAILVAVAVVEGVAVLMRDRRAARKPG